VGYGEDRRLDSVYIVDSTYCRDITRHYTTEHYTTNDLLAPG
jgi:hypothetical protein